MSWPPIDFVAAAAALTLVIVLGLIWPLLRRRSRVPASRAEFALSVQRDQLAEIERDVERGLLAAADAAAARLEVQRRMLAEAAAVPADAPSTDTRASPAASSRRPLAVVLGVLLPVIAGGLYAALGSPRVADQPLAERRAQEIVQTGGDTGGPQGEGEDAARADDDAQLHDLEEGVQRLARRLEGQPADMQGWFMLGRGYMALGRNAEAVAALQRARALMPGDPDVEGAYAEALIAAASGRVGAEARTALQGLLQADPTNPRARFLLALDLAQQGDLHGAAQGWADLIALSPPDAPWLPLVQEHLQRAAAMLGIDPASVQPGAEARALATAPADTAGTGGAAIDAAPAPPAPSAADVEAAAKMSEDERAKMIRGMVDRLAARLQQEPNDADGWRRLAQAYRVLGEADKARDAQAQADALAGR